jgi:hypothetical protein
VSYSIQFSGAPDGPDGPFQVATTAGWAQFARWAESLPDGFEAVKDLADDGSMTGTDLLAEQLERALREHPDPLVGSTVQSLAAVLGVGDPEELAEVIML